MHRIDTSTAQRDKFGKGKNGFTRGNPQTGTPATQLDYLHCDAIQEEIANVIESAGFMLDKSKHDQLATAIKELVSKGNVKLNSSTNSTSETEAATPLAVKKVNDNAISAKNNANDALNIANSAVKRSGDNMSGDLFVKNQRVIVDGEAFPFRGYLRGSSLNNIRGMQHGVYLQNMNDLANIENGYPIPAAGTLIVTQTGGDGVNGCVQTYTAYYAARQFIRTYRESSNVWSNWVEQITTANIKNYCSQIVVLYPGGSEGAPSTLRANQRIVIDNPFKTNFVMAWVEFIENNTWYKHDEIIFNGNTGYGTKTNQCGDKIIIQTGNSAVRTRCFHDGNPTGADNIMTSLPYRLIIVKIEA